MAYSGTLTVQDTASYTWMTADGTNVVIGVLGGTSATLNSTNKSATLRPSSGPGDYSASASWATDNNVVTLGYTVVFSGQSSSTTYSGTIVSYGT